MSTKVDVEDAISYFLAGESYNRIALRFDVTKQAIHCLFKNFITGKGWSELKYDTDLVLKVTKEVNRRKINMPKGRQK